MTRNCKTRNLIRRFISKSSEGHAAKTNLYKLPTLVTAYEPIAMMKKLLPLVLLLPLLAGCASTTNLTPTRHARTPDGVYPFEVIFRTSQHSVRHETIKAYVLIDFDSYPMHRVPVVSNRWEAAIPIPAGKKYVNYRYKFDYSYNAIPVPEKDSKLSPVHTLQIVEE